VLVGSSGVMLCRSILGRAIWALYPGLVVFSIVATANHFLLDAIAGAGVFLVATAISLGVSWVRRGRPLSPIPQQAPAPLA
jgi:membrane protease YdiL (CAAX protease family)